METCSAFYAVTSALLLEIFVILSNCCETLVILLFR
jgi:hypothetical protein